MKKASFPIEGLDKLGSMFEDITHESSSTYEQVKHFCLAIDN